MAHWLRDRGFEAYAVRGGVAALARRARPRRGPGRAEPETRPDRECRARSPRCATGDFRRYSAGVLFSLIGNWVEAAAFGYVVLLLGGSAATLGLIGFLNTHPEPHLGAARRRARRSLRPPQAAARLPGREHAASRSCSRVLWATDTLTVPLMGAIASSAEASARSASRPSRGCWRRPCRAEDLESAVAINSLSAPGRSLPRARDRGCPARVGRPDLGVRVTRPASSACWSRSRCSRDSRVRERSRRDARRRDARRPPLRLRPAQHRVADGPDALRRALRHPSGGVHAARHRPLPARRRSRRRSARSPPRSGSARCSARSCCSSSRAAEQGRAGAGRLLPDRGRDLPRSGFDDRCRSRSCSRSSAASAASLFVGLSTVVVQTMSTDEMRARVDGDLGRRLRRRAARSGR